MASTMSPSIERLLNLALGDNQPTNQPANQPNQLLEQMCVCVCVRMLPSRTGDKAQPETIPTSNVYVPIHQII